MSRLTLVSRSAQQGHAWTVSVHDGVVSAPAPASHLKGTSIEVRDLFFNVPARRKFLRSENTEYQHIARMLERLTLSRFDVAFALIHNGKTVWSVPVARSGAHWRRSHRANWWCRAVLTLVSIMSMPTRRASRCGCRKCSG